MAGDNRMTRPWSVARRVIVTASMLIATSVAAFAAQPGFPTAESAVTALVDAIQKHDPAMVARVLGPGSEKLVRSGDPVKDREESQRFLDAYAARHSLAEDGPDRMVLHVGTDDWPLPIPLVRQNDAWHFDASKGAQEIVDRRIGRNELAAISFCLAYVDAQNAYFNLFKQATGMGAYARFLVSKPGNYDGLYWPASPGIPDSPLEPVVAHAVAEEGYPGQLEQGRQMPYQGYYYRILTGQGPNAPGGARSYLENGKMTGGFGLLAWPAIYAASAIMTFIVNQDGTVFQADLGPDTPVRVKAIQTFDPGLSWARIDVSGP